MVLMLVLMSSLDGMAPNCAALTRGTNAVRHRVTCYWQDPVVKHQEQYNEKISNHFMLQVATVIKKVYSPETYHKSNNPKTTSFFSINQ